MATVKILLGILCIAFIGNGWMSDRSVLTGAKDPVYPTERACVLKVATGEIGVREQTGRNDGLKVESYLQYIGLGKGHAWCAAFVSWVYGKCGYAIPRSGWSPALFPAKRLVKDGLSGDVFGIYFPSMGRIAHAGIIERKAGDWVFTIEGNTNVQAGRDGDGVYRKRRHIKTISKFADWIGKGDKK